MRICSSVVALSRVRVCVDVVMDVTVVVVLVVVACVCVCVCVRRAGEFEDRKVSGWTYNRRTILDMVQ